MHTQIQTLGSKFFQHRRGIEETGEGGGGFYYNCSELSIHSVSCTDTCQAIEAGLPSAHSTPNASLTQLMINVCQSLTSAFYMLSYSKDSYIIL